MPVNAWGAGQDALLGFLANRDAKQRLDEDRSRRDRMDQEAFADRSQAREIQAGQLRSLDDDRTERRQLATEERAEKKTKADRETANAAMMGQLLDAYDAAKTPEEKYDIGVRIVNANGKMPAAPRQQTPQRPIAVRPGTTLIDPETHKPIYSVPAAEKAAKGPKDDPSLPSGVKSYIDSLTQKADGQGNRYTAEQALDELSRASGKLRADHPNLDMGKVARYAKALFPKTEKDPLGRPVMHKADAPAAATTPAAPAAPAAGGGADAQVSSLLGSAKPGKYTLTDGSVWLKMPNGSIQKAQ